MKVASLSLFLTMGLAAQNGTWTSLPFPASPAATYGATMVYDSARDRTVLIGGLPSNTGETWENDGSTWVLRASFGPSGAAGYYQVPSLAAAYDSTNQRTVLVRGNSPIETWFWNGQVWAVQSTAATPPMRHGYAIAYDAARQRVVLFGGASGTIHLSDTWEFDGTNWLQRSSGGPSPRRDHAMAYDSARGRTVLFGGINDQSPGLFFYNDTWEWNGQVWVEYFGVASPPARHGHGMAFDALRGVSVVAGGRGVGQLTDTWDWNGAQWTNRQASVAYPERVAMAFDSQRSRVFAFGGRSNLSLVGGQAYGLVVTSHIAAVSPYGAGCAGPGGVPLLAANPGSVPRLGGVLQVNLSNLPTGPLDVPIGWLGFDNQSWGGIPLPFALDPLGFPGCSALLAPAAQVLLSNVGGTASWSLSVPFLPAFAGSRFYLQGGVLALGFSPGGLVFSRGLAATIGR